MKYQITIILAFFIFGYISTVFAAEETTPPYIIKDLQVGKQFFKPTSEDRKNFEDIGATSQLNLDGTMTCEANIAYPEITFSSPYQTQYQDYINQRFKLLAENSLCNIDYAYRGVKPTVTFFNNGRIYGQTIMSVMFEITDLGVGGNGSCHSTYKYMTFDLQSGEEYTLGNILRAQDFLKIKADVLTAFKKRNDMNEQAMKQLEDALDNDFWSMGFYIDGMDAYLDINRYLISCANGPHFPFLIDRKYLKDTAIKRTLTDAKIIAPRTQNSSKKE